MSDQYSELQRNWLKKKKKEEKKKEKKAGLLLVSDSTGNLCYSKPE